MLAAAAPPALPLLAPSIPAAGVPAPVLAVVLPVRLWLTLPVLGLVRFCRRRWWVRPLPVVPALLRFGAPSRAGRPDPGPRPAARLGG